MANRFPLIVDSDNSNIKELPSGDTLILTGNDLNVGGTLTTGDSASIGGNITITGKAIATTNTIDSASGNLTLDFSTNQNFIVTLKGNTTLVNPTTETDGQTGFIVFKQDTTGSRTLSLGTDYETAAAAGITLSTAANSTDVVPYIVVDSTRILLGSPQLAFA